MNDLSVLMISPQFRPVYGGYERAAERLSGALARQGVKVVVVSERRNRSWARVERVDGFEIRRIWCVHRRRLHTITSLISFAVFLLRHGRRFKVWHVHQYGFHSGLAIALGKILRRPVALKLTNSEEMGISQVLGDGIVGRTLKFLHRRVRGCIAISEETLEEAVTFGIPPDRIYLIPNGMSRDEIMPATDAERSTVRAALALSCETLVLSISRLSDEKNPLGLLEAWARIDPVSRRGALLAMVGDGPQQSAVQGRLLELDLDSVLLTGRRNDVESWYRAADIFVIASRNEGLSNSMIEALAAGLPVISTDVSGSSYLVRDKKAGVVIANGRTDELAAAIELLLVDEQARTRLAANAREVFEENFLVKSVALKTISLYRDMQRPR